MPSWSLPALAAADLELPSFYIEPLVTPDSTTLVFGPREAGKTQLVFTLMRAIQRTEALFGRYPARRARTTLIEVDMPLTQVQRRVQAACQHFDFDADLFRIADYRSLNIPTSTPSSEWVREVGGFEPEIIIFDSLRKCHQLDENSTTVPSLVYGRARELFPDAARIFLHHVTKPPSMIQKGSAVRADDESFRGTSAWLDDADTGILLQRKGKHRTFQVTRGRHADDDVKDDIFGVRFVEEGLFLEPVDPTPLTWLLGWKIEHREAERKEALAALAIEFPKLSRPSLYRVVKTAGW